MTDIRFYHLQRATLEQALPLVLQKAQERGLRAVVRVGSRERAEVLDAALWTFDPASFLPHGYVRDGTEKEQPVFISTENDNPNGADLLVLADGVTADDVAGFTMCCEFLDGNDDAAVAAARERWKAYKDAGHDIS